MPDTQQIGWNAHEGAPRGVWGVFLFSETHLENFSPKFTLLEPRRFLTKIYQTGKKEETLKLSFFSLQLLSKVGRK